MKHAVLVIAHHQFDLLKMCMEMLDDERFDFFVHIDKRSDVDFNSFSDVLHYSEFTFIPRINVNWGGYSQISCEMSLLEYAMEHGHYDYYHLISGVDLPLKTPQQIDDFFIENNGKNFVHFAPINDYVIDRVKYYYPFQELLRRGKTKGLQIAANRAVQIQRHTGINRLPKERLYFGSNWFSVTNDLGKYVLDNKQEIRKRYRATHCCDEVFLQTLVYNSSFRDTLYVDTINDDYRGNMRFIDWNRGKPYTFQSSDYESLVNSPFLFARKFDLENDPEICEKLYQHVISSKNSI